MLTLKVDWGGTPDAEKCLTDFLITKQCSNINLRCNSSVQKFISPGEGNCPPPLRITYGLNFWFKAGSTM